MVGMCVFTVNHSDCDLAFNNNKSEIIILIYSVFLQPILPLISSPPAASESVNVSLPLPFFGICARLCLRTTTRGSPSCGKERSGEASWCIDQAASLMKFDIRIQPLL